MYRFLKDAKMMPVITIVLSDAEEWDGNIMTSCNTNTTWNRLSDDASRFLYEKRCMWSLTGDDRYITDIIRFMLRDGKADALIEKAKSVSDRLVIRGLGNEYHTIRQYYPELEFALIADRDPVKIGWGEFEGHKVISTDDFYKNYSDHYVMITSSAFHSEIKRELKEHGIPEEHILDFGGLSLAGEQYFEPGIIAPKEHEVFVDGGSFDGTSFRRFAAWCGGKYDGIYAFEPDLRNAQRIRESLEKDPMPNVEVIPKGLWDEETVLHFNSSGTQGSAIVEESETVQEVASIETDSIDHVVGDAAVSFIKLDVEGAEKKALLGAKETIRRCHPRMAISIYHKPEDIFELPELILEMADDYRFYLRHYQLSRFETILYTV